MDPNLTYKIPTTFLENLKKNDVTSSYFEEIDEDKFHRMISHVFSYVYNESISIHDFERLFDAHKQIPITDDVARAWVHCLSNTLYEVDVAPNEALHIIQKVIYITKRLVMGPTTPIFIIDSIMNDVMNKPTDHVDKQYILDRLDSLKEILEIVNTPR